MARTHARTHNGLPRQEFYVLVNVPLSFLHSSSRHLSFIVKLHIIACVIPLTLYATTFPFVLIVHLMASSYLRRSKGGEGTSVTTRVYAQYFTFIASPVFNTLCAGQLPKHFFCSASPDARVSVRTCVCSDGNVIFVVRSFVRSFVRRCVCCVRATRGFIVCMLVLFDFVVFHNYLFVHLYASIANYYENSSKLFLTEKNYIKTIIIWLYSARIFL